MINEEMASYKRELNRQFSLLPRLARLLNYNKVSIPLHSLFRLEGPHRTQSGIFIGERFTAKISTRSRFLIDRCVKLAVFTGWHHYHILLLTNMAPTWEIRPY